MSLADRAATMVMGGDSDRRLAASASVESRTYMVVAARQVTGLGRQKEVVVVVVVVMRCQSAT